MNTAINHYQSFPDAQCLLEALRGMDYTPSSAIADLLDNSISANATEVHLLFLPQNDKNPKPIVVIADNGNGMASDELLKAMRLGGINPRNTRKVTDLGRFGLGSPEKIKRTLVFVGIWILSPITKRTVAGIFLTERFLLIQKSKS